jgi:hypothetical protein
MLPAMSEDATFPTWPPGLWRRIVLTPEPHAISGALEDDVHRFHLRLEHADGVIIGVIARSVRIPMTGCPGASTFMVERLTGRTLAEVAAEDSRAHCTHLYDLAVVCAAHAGDILPSLYDFKVADRVEGRTTATVERDGEQVLLWQLEGTGIVGPGGWAGRDLKALSRWKHELPSDQAEWAELLRRAILVSGVRNFFDDTSEPASTRTHRLGACFNYQLPVAETSYRHPNWHRDWSLSDEAPLEDYTPLKGFA